MNKYTFYKLSYIFSDDCIHYFSNETEYYIFKKETDEHPIGEVLILDDELRDGTLLVFVDEEGHTVVLNGNCKGYEDYFLAIESDEMKEIHEIMKEFGGKFLEPYIEIRNLRKKLGKSLDKSP